MMMKERCQKPRAPIIPAFEAPKSNSSTPPATITAMEMGLIHRVFHGERHIAASGTR